MGKKGWEGKPLGSIFHGDNNLTHASGSFMSSSLPQVIKSMPLPWSFSSNHEFWKCVAIQVLVTMLKYCHLFPSPKNVVEVSFLAQSHDEGREERIKSKMSKNSELSPLLISFMSLSSITLSRQCGKKFVSEWGHVRQKTQIKWQQEQQSPGKIYKLGNTKLSGLCFLKAMHLHRIAK